MGLEFLAHRKAPKSSSHVQIAGAASLFSIIAALHIHIEEGGPGGGGAGNLRPKVSRGDSARLKFA